MKNKNKSLLPFRAFTMIELLVSISIVAIVFSIGMANYREFSRREALNGIVKELKGNLRSAQQLSLSGVKPDAPCDILNGYAVSIVSSGYVINANCSSNAGIISNVEYKVVNLDSDISITSTISPIIFKVLGHGTNLDTSATITLTHIAGTQASVVVGTAGDIY